MPFEQQEPAANSGFTRSLPQQQQSGVRLDPNAKKPQKPWAKRPPERRAV
jgi:hypothetical protein